MTESRLRLINIEISNFKNVEYGFISFDDKVPYQSSVLGIYGQNGSGKSALIDVVSMFRTLITGKKVPSWYADYINVDSDYSHVKISFSIFYNGEQFESSYEWDFRSLIVDDTSSNEKINQITKKIVSIYNEKLRIAFITEKKRMSDIIDTGTDKVFVPDSKFKELLTITNQNDMMNLLVMKKMSEQNSKSFIFSAEFLSKLKENMADKSAEAQKYISIISRIVAFGRFELFLFDSTSLGYVNLNFLPMSFRYEKENRGIAAQILINMNEPSLVASDKLDTICNVIDNMNIVLTQIIPDLTIEVRRHGEESLKDGTIANRIELMTRRKNKVIPLKYESDGIKKIISILDLLIVVYNNSSITVAIDEIDSGIFEYLLGEILKIVSEQGRGQLIFTSHNLRPLETIDKRFIVFTTTNPKNRYVRMKYVMANNNLRDVYYRDISVGTQNEELYEFTDDAKIAMAFRRAGVICES